MFDPQLRGGIYDHGMLLAGINHVAVLTNDTDRLHAFYREVFDAEVFADQTIGDGERDGRLSFVTVGPHTQLNVFQLPGNAEAEHQTPMFGRGRIDHMGLQAASQEAFDLIRDRLIERGSTDGFVTDFGIAISLFFIDPDGLEGEVLLDRPDAGPTDLKPPGTPAAGYERVTPT
jgi:catechol 2,3-dioxygenase-like lactoylglutathione lyase family enzyme